jgi:phosphatidate cytidylyltransferase
MIYAAHQRGPEPLVVAFGLTSHGGCRLARDRSASRLRRRDVAGGVFAAFYPCLLGGFAAHDAGRR